jgi:hypothetical protein
MLIVALGLAALVAIFFSKTAVFAADAILSWDPNAESDLAGYHVHYGATSGNYSVVIPVGMVTSYTVTGLAPGTFYFAVSADDTSGNRSNVSNEVSKVIPDTTAPVISAVAASALTASGATVTWTTNEPATSLVEYGLTTSYGASSALNSTRVTAHSRTLSGLSAATLYHYRVISTDAAGNTAVSADNTFTTASAADTTPPTLSSIASGSVTSSGATITWTTNEASTTQVEYGTTTAYGASSTLNSALLTAHSATLSGLQGATTYNYRVRSADAAGNVAVSGNQTFTTAAAPDTTAPTLSSIASGSVTSSGAIVTWTTNEASTTQVEYGTTTAYGASSTLDSALLTAHSATLSGLQGATTYNYRVRSADAAGNVAVSGNQTFTTAAAPDTTAPVISGVVASSTGATSTVITWSTNEPATSVVDYGLGTSYGSSSTDTTLLTSHSRSLTGLTASTTYHFRVRSADAAGNSASSADVVFTTSAAPDTTAPTLSSIASGSVTSSGAIVTWTTNEASTTQVEYGTTTAYGASTTLNSALLTAHSATLSGLQAATTYNYRVRSADAAGNIAVSSNRTFTTAAAPDTTGPTISNLVAGNLTPTSAVITWSTNEAATSQVEFGPTTAYGQQSPASATLVSSHRQTLTNLTAGATYHVRVQSADAAGNVSRSNDLTVALPAVADATPPADVRQFSASGSPGQIRLNWINPPDSDFVGVQIRVRMDRFPSSPTDGELVGDFTGQPGEAGEALHDGLVDGVTYYYAAASYDFSGNRQNTAFASAVSGTPSSAVNEDSSPQTGGCGMIIPRDGGPPSGPWQAADLLLMAVVAIYLMRRRLVCSPTSGAVTSPG